MKNQQKEPSVCFSQFLFLIIPPPITDDYPTNRAIAQNAASFLRQIFQKSDDWEDDCKRRVAADYVRLCVFGEPGVILKDFGSVYWRDDTFEVFRQPIAFLSASERRLIEDIIALAKEECTNYPY